ncbi:hypothetical protein CV014_06750 [Nostoc sp. CMAA1605]|nr:hypothetical protein [Nostoc sp. CMAA1605]
MFIFRVDMAVNKEFVKPVESLIEDLTDEELSSCFGGCGWYNQRGNECEVETINGRYKITEYFFINGKLHSSSYITDSKAGLWYDPNGSNRYKNYIRNM